MPPLRLPWLGGAKYSAVSCLQALCLGCRKAMIAIGPCFSHGFVGADAVGSRSVIDHHRFSPGLAERDGRQSGRARIPAGPPAVMHQRAGELRRASSVASPIICRSALAIEAHRGVASLANTARYGLRDAPCAALRWLRAAYDI